MWRVESGGWRVEGVWMVESGEWRVESGECGGRMGRVWWADGSSVSNNTNHIPVLIIFD